MLQLMTAFGLCVDCYFLVRDVIYIMLRCQCPSVHLSVTEVHGAL